MGLTYSISEEQLEVINDINNSIYYGYGRKLRAIKYSILAHLYHINHLGDRLVVVCEGYDKSILKSAIYDRLVYDGQNIFSSKGDAISLASGPTVEFYSVSDILRNGLPAEEIDKVFFAIQTKYTKEQMTTVVQDCVFELVDYTELRGMLIGISDEDIARYV